MKIVGVGIGPGMLTLQAIQAIKNARIVYGSKRALELAEKYIQGEKREIKDYQNLEIPEDAIVLSTGDPMFSGLGKLGGEIIPGISTLQTACARLAIEQTEVTTVNFHGRNPTKAKEKLLDQLKKGETVFILPDPHKYGAKEIAELLLKEKLTQYQIFLLQRLGYPDEKIKKGTPQNPPQPENKLYSLLIKKL